MKIIYVEFKRINVRNYLTKENTAVFETFIEDTEGKQIIRPRLEINKAKLGIIKAVIKEEEKIHSRFGEETKVVVQDKDFVKEAISRFIDKLKEITITMDRKDPSKYLDALTRINRLSLNFEKAKREFNNEPKNKPSDWREKLRLTRLRLRKNEPQE